MSELSDYRITEEDVAQNGVIAAPDRLTGTAAQNKAVFDRLIREAVKGKYNAMLAAVEAHLVWEPYDEEKTYVPGNKVVYNGSSYLCTAECAGVLPTTVTYWRLVASRGVDGTGAGDMRADIYDPNHVETDVFTYVDERTDTYNRVETLSEDVAQLFVDIGLCETAPSTPNEAFIWLLAGESIDGTINVTAPEGAAVTVDWYGITIDAHTGTGVPVTVNINKVGVYRITSVNGEETESVTAEISRDVRNVDVCLASETELATQILTGTGEWIPQGVKGDVHIRLFGAGGNGAANAYYGGGGGGGGEMETFVFTPVLGRKYKVTVGNGGGGPTSFGNMVTANGGANASSIGASSDGGNGGSGGGGSGFGVAGAGSYGGGGGHMGSNTGGNIGGKGGPYGGAGGSGGYNVRAYESGGLYGGAGGAAGVNGAKGTDTSEMSLDFVGKGLGGNGGAYGGGGGGGYGGNGGNGGAYGGGGGGGYGGNGGNGGSGDGSRNQGGGGGGGGYGGNGGAGGTYGGGGGGGYGSGGTGGNGASTTSGAGGNGGYAAGGGGSFTGAVGVGGKGIIVLTYQTFKAEG